MQSYIETNFVLQSATSPSNPSQLNDYRYKTLCGSWVHLVQMCETRPVFLNLPMWPSSESTRAPCAVERDALNGWERARPPVKENSF